VRGPPSLQSCSTPDIRGPREGAKLQDDKALVRRYVEDFRSAGMLRAAFPDPHAVIHDQIGEGDEVVTRKSFYGTHRGECWQSQRRNARAVDSVPSRAPMPAILEGWAGHG
jgi:hypothetical protein